MNKKVPEKIVRFITRHHVLTLATFGGKVPYCSNCFYAYHKEKNYFICLSDTQTKHINDLKNSNKVGISIVLETEVIGKIQGLQINAEMQIPPNEEMLKEAKNLYLKRFPYAIISNAEIWILKPYYMKYTDNKLGFGKKIIWGQPDEEI